MQSLFLGFIQMAAQFDFTIDSVQKSLLRFTVPAIIGMNSEMLQPDCDALYNRKVIDLHAPRLESRSS
jgi:hypothetical protein